MVTPPECSAGFPWNILPSSVLRRTSARHPHRERDMDLLDTSTAFQSWDTAESPGFSSMKSQTSNYNLIEKLTRRLSEHNFSVPRPTSLQLGFPGPSPPDRGTTEQQYTETYRSAFDVSPQRPQECVCLLRLCYSSGQF